MATRPICHLRRPHSDLLPLDLSFHDANNNDGIMNADGIVRSQLPAVPNEVQKIEQPSNKIPSPPAHTTMLDGSSTTATLLADPLDEATLSSGSILLRKQIELFEATEADVADRKSKGGHISVQQVGIRCIHCAHLPFGECARGAASFPTSIQLVYQAARNWQRHHLNACACIPIEIKEEFKAIKGKQKGKAIAQYWAESCQRKGLCNVAASAWDEAESRCQGVYFRMKVDAANIFPPVPPSTNSAANKPNEIAAIATENSQHRASVSEPFLRAARSLLAGQTQAQAPTQRRSSLSGAIRDRPIRDPFGLPMAGLPGRKSRRTSLDDTASTGGLSVAWEGMHHLSHQQLHQLAGIFDHESLIDITPPVLAGAAASGEDIALSTNNGNEYYPLDVTEFFYGGSTLPDFIAKGLSGKVLSEKKGDNSGSSPTSPQELCSLLTLQAALNLRSDSCEDPTLLSGGQGGAIRDQSSAVEEAQKNGNVSALSLLFQLRIFLAYLFAQYEFAGQLITAMEDFTAEEKSLPSSELRPIDFLYKGLVAAVLARGGNRNRWMPVLLECREKLNRMCLVSHRHQHSLKLLEAELALTNGIKDAAVRLYDEAIHAAKENGLLHQSALACERAAIFHSSVASNEALASSYLNQARDLYLRWGAKRKVMLLLPKD